MVATIHSQPCYGHRVLDALTTASILAKLAERFGADAVWIFGSQARGQARPTSDIDIAVLFQKRPTVLERLDLQAELAEHLRKPVDLVDLDGASPVLAMQVLRHGQLLLDGNPRRRVAFTTLLVSRYEDLRIVRAPIERKIAERMKHGRT